MKQLYRSLVISAAGLLLGLGLCGIDAALHPNSHDSIAGGAISVIGFALTFVAGLTLLFSLVALLLSFLKSLFENRK